MSKHRRFLKLYTRDGEFFASCLHAEDAALIMTNYPGGTVRDGHQKRRTLWTEGESDLTGGESADMVAKVIYDRREAMDREDAARRASKKVLTGDAMYPGRQFANFLPKAEGQPQTVKS